VHKHTQTIMTHTHAGARAEKNAQPGVRTNTNTHAQYGRKHSTTAVARSGTLEWGVHCTDRPSVRGCCKCNTGIEDGAERTHLLLSDRRARSMFSLFSLFCFVGMSFPYHSPAAIDYLMAETGWRWLGIRRRRCM